MSGGEQGEGPAAGAPGPALDSRGLPHGYPYHPDLEITPREVRNLQGDARGGLVLIDCRTQAEWRTARIAGAELIPLDQLAARTGEIEDAIDRAAATAGDEDAVKVVIHCHHGGRSMKAALFLRQRGIPAVSMAGGIDLWAVDIDRGVPRY